MRLRVVREIRRRHSQILLLWILPEKKTENKYIICFIRIKKKCEWNEVET